MVPTAWVEVPCIAARSQLARWYKACCAASTLPAGPRQICSTDRSTLPFAARHRLSSQIPVISTPGYTKGTSPASRQSDT